MKGFMKNRLPGLLISVLLTIALTLFMGMLVKTKLLPGKLLLVAGGVFLLFVLSVFLLTMNAKRTGGMIAGSIMTVLVLVVLMIGTPYLTKAVNTLSSMTGVNVELTDVGIFVKNDSSVQNIAGLSGGSVGIMDVLDRENTNKSLQELEAEAGTVTVLEFPGVSELADGLLQDQVDAIVINAAYLDLMADMEGYENVTAQIRELHSYQIETVVENVQKAPEKGGWNIQDLFSGKEEEQEDRVFTMYISGIDTYGSVSAKSRSDVNILATINVDTRQVLLVSTPRDFYVPLPISNGIPDKLTHAGIYGVECSMGTLEMLYNTEIDYYFRVNFSGFKKIIDALGGVTVHSDYSFSASSAGYYFSEGENNLNGDEALAFARERYAFSAGDRQRGKNQMEVIRAVIEKAMSPAILTGYTGIMESVAGNFETSMPYDLIAEIVRDQLDNGGSWNIVSTSVDGTGDTRRPYSLSTGAYVMIPNQETVDAAIAMIKQVKNGEILG